MTDCSIYCAMWIESKIKITRIKVMNMWSVFQFHGWRMWDITNSNQIQARTQVLRCSEEALSGITMLLRMAVNDNSSNCSDRLLAAHSEKGYKYIIEINWGRKRTKLYFNRYHFNGKVYKHLVLIDDLGWHQNTNSYICKMSDLLLTWNTQMK